MLLHFDLPTRLSIAIALAAILACLAPIIAQTTEPPVETPATLIEQCRFHDALEAIDLQAPDASLLRGLALIGLGRYDEAAAALESPNASGNESARLEALAKIAEARGQIDQSLNLMAQAVAAETKTIASPESLDGANTLARLHSDYGRLALRYGRTDLARDQFRAAITFVSTAHMKMHELGIPHDENDPRMFAGPATAGMAQLFASEGDDRRAERTFRSIVGRANDPATLRDLAAFALARGDDRSAQALLNRLIAQAENAPKHRRDLALALADAGREFDTALAIAEAAFADGPNTESRDTLAWILYCKGEHDRAAEILDEALKVGTQNPLILFHAGMIAHARGQTDDARRLLKQALAINPNFDPIASPMSRSTLGNAE
ncbi:tetratricopeptide repeat protein [Tautonia rosea]|uniref:tetratricopeptide repeat protein n=1 Tax=Tautonia rosea TaxID=2728037 RepID=UPI0014731D9E|nr:tetratricopeptide repeat protein [Tautonia rosea]